MDPDMRGMLRWTSGSALGFGLVFVVVAAARAVGAGASLAAVAGPMAAFGVIGLTVGGLVGPLLRGIWVRRRGALVADREEPIP